MPRLPRMPSYAGRRSKVAEVVCLRAVDSECDDARQEETSCSGTFERRVCFISICMPTGVVSSDRHGHASAACESATPISQGGRLQVSGLTTHVLWILPSQNASSTAVKWP